MLSIRAQPNEQKNLVRVSWHFIPVRKPREYPSGFGRFVVLVLEWNHWMQTKQEAMGVDDD